MDFNELMEKYQVVLSENIKLKKEIKALREKLDDLCPEPDNNKQEEETQFNLILPEKNENEEILVTNQSEPSEKIKLFMSLFRGRQDIYAKRWESKTTGKSGYSPVCLNEWKPKICRKPKDTCAKCENKAYASLDEQVIDDHLRGRGDMVIGIYPMLIDETCHFLAIDFDDDDWQKDVSAIRDVCVEFNIHTAVERSRSGNGAHMWFFFENPTPAVTARKFGSAILTYAMSKRHEIKFKSYDRLFPNQDTMPKGGMGNLIALPLQKAARKDNNSEFIDEGGNSYNDQWAFLANIRKLSENEVETLIQRLCHGNELGVLKIEEDEITRPWETNKIKLSRGDFPDSIEIVKANMIFIPKAGVSQKALNHLKRLAAFKNPEFYRAQAMRLSTKQLPRIISCSDETEEYLCLPRGCADEVKHILSELAIEIKLVDKTNLGRTIDIEFNGSLRDEQPKAAQKLLQNENGILCGTTAFGKTVVAINLIAQRKLNTLILVDKVSLVAQWKKRLSEFLTINETLPSECEVKKRGRRKERSIIGQLGAGKDELNGIIDIAVMQSINRMGEVKDCVKNYGMVIIDECHHVSAFSFETILKSINAKYVYGLTATPARKDGHHPIIFMQCGPIRYRDDAKKQALMRPFEHYIIPRFTSLRIPIDKDEKELAIQDLYAEIVESEMRNQQIVEDVVRSHESGRNCLVLTERTAHVEKLTYELQKRIDNVISLIGGMGAKDTREIMKQISDVPVDKPLTLVATGKYVGEGFDLPRLDTLFLAMPISWKGTLQQYAGRLHRLWEGKNEVQIYDYVDIQIGMLERMYSKRLSGYASIGYKAKGEALQENTTDIIFDKNNFLPVYTNDMINARKEIIIVSPFITKKRTSNMLQYLRVAYQNKVKVIVVTRPYKDFAGKDAGALNEAIHLLEESGVSLVFKSNIHQKFAIIDEKIVWYGNINLLSFGNSEESIMRLDSFNIANELLKSIEK